jgi:uncharacterized protein YciI
MDKMDVLADMDGHVMTTRHCHRHRDSLLWLARKGALLMAKFLVTYHGGGMPDTEEGRQQAVASFGAWVGRVGDALVDPGAPLGPARTVSDGAVRTGSADGPTTGYSVLEADNLDAAVALVQDHPFIGRGGSLQVTEAVAP